VNGTAIGTTLTGVDTPGDINAGEKWLWVDDTSALYRIDPTTLEMVAVAYGRNSPQQKPITISSNGAWVREPDSGDIVKVDPDTATLAFDWLFPSDTNYVNDLVAGGETLWATALSENGGQILKLDPDTGTVITRVNTDVDTFNPLIFEDGSLWATRSPGDANASWVVVRLDTALEVVAEIDLPNVNPGFYFNDQIVSGDGHIFLSGYACECPDSWNPDDPIGRIIRIDPATNTIVTKPIGGVNDYGEGLDLGFGPFLDLAYGDGWLWGVRLVDDWETRDIVRIDPTTLEIVGGPITTEPLPWAVEVAFGRLWISHYNDGVITIIHLADLN
jgi:streptogramin lyase